MNSLLAPDMRIEAMGPAAIERVRRLEALALAMPQHRIETRHVFHAGLYARTVMVPAGVMITGVLIKVPTLLIVQGHAVVHVDEGPHELQGYNVITAAAGRKQALFAVADTHLTMIFATDAGDLETAERQFTDELDKLMTRKEDKACRV